MRSKALQLRRRGTLERLQMTSKRLVVGLAVILWLGFQNEATAANRAPEPPRGFVRSTWQLPGSNNAVITRWHRGDAEFLQVSHVRHLPTVGTEIILGENGFQFVSAWELHGCLHGSVTISRYTPKSGVREYAYDAQFENDSGAFILGYENTQTDAFPSDVQRFFQAMCSARTLAGLDGSAGTPIAADTARPYSPPARWLGGAGNAVWTSGTSAITFWKSDVPLNGPSNGPTSIVAKGLLPSGARFVTDKTTSIKPCSQKVVSTWLTSSRIVDRGGATLLSFSTFTQRTRLYSIVLTYRRLGSAPEDPRVIHSFLAYCAK
jgi:hypothetical protein